VAGTRLAPPLFAPLLHTSTTLQFATEAAAAAQFLQLSTARLLPGRSGCSARRNGSKLALASTDLPGAPPTLAPEHQHRHGPTAHAWSDPIGAAFRPYAAIDMVRASQAFSRQSCSPCCVFMQLNPPATHFLTPIWLARAVREAGVACFADRASRAAQASRATTLPSNRRCQLLFALQIDESTRSRLACYFGSVVLRFLRPIYFPVLLDVIDTDFETAMTGLPRSSLESQM